MKARVYRRLRAKLYLSGYRILGCRLVSENHVEIAVLLPKPVEMIHINLDLRKEE